MSLPEFTKHRVITAQRNAWAPVGSSFNTGGIAIREGNLRKLDELKKACQNSTEEIAKRQKWHVLSSECRPCACKRASKRAAEGIKIADSLFRIGKHGSH